MCRSCLIVKLVSDLSILAICNHLPDTFMQKTARLYQDTRTATASSESNLDRLNGDLQDVTRIMTKNMEELLWRGDSLDSKFRRHSLNAPALTTPSSARNVTPFHIITIRVRKIPESSPGHQFLCYAAPVCTPRRIWPIFPHLCLVEVLLITGQILCIIRHTYISEPCRGSILFHNADIQPNFHLSACLSC